nr:hypothetical protein [uncultured Sphaerochaeta sp.]
MNITKHSRRNISQVGFAILLILLMVPLHAEIVIGGTLSPEYYLEFEDRTSSQHISLSGGLLLSSYAETYTFTSELKIREDMLVGNDGFEHSVITLDKITDAMSLSSFTFDFYALENLTVSLGKFPHSYGQSEIMNPLGVFMQTDYSQLLRGNLSSAQVFPFLLKASLFSDVYTVDLLIAPYTPLYNAFPLDSSFFPMKDIPSHIDMGAAGIKTLDDISYQEGTTNADESPFSLQLGISRMFGPLDVTIFGFHGWDAHYPLTTTLSFDTDTYSLFLKPNYHKGFSFGGSLSSTYDRFRIFTDILYTPEKLFSTNWYSFRSPYAASVMEQEQVLTQSFAYSIGSSIDLPELDTFVQVEFYDQYIAEQEEMNIPHQLISQLLSTIIDFNPQGGITSLRLISLHSFSDASNAFFLSLQFDFSQEFSIAAKAPLFLGNPETTFGQYKNIYALSLSSHIRF